MLLLRGDGREYIRRGRHCGCDVIERPPRPIREVHMSSTVETVVDVRPFHLEVPEEQLAELRRRLRRLGGRAGSSSTTALRECSRPRSRRSFGTGRPSTTGGDRGEAECAAAVHDRDRRVGHPLHPRQVSARERAAAGHDARLARLRRRAARHRRPADRPDRPRRQCRGCLPSGAALPSRVRPLGRAGRDRLGSGPDGTSVGRAHAPARLYPVRRAGRGCRCGRHRRDGPAGAGRA